METVIENEEKKEHKNKNNLNNKGNTENRNVINQVKDMVDISKISYSLLEVRNLLEEKIVDHIIEIQLEDVKDFIKNVGVNLVQVYLEKIEDMKDELVLIDLEVYQR